MISFTKKRFAALLGVSEKKLQELESVMEPGLVKGDDIYTTGQLSAFRKALNIYPPEVELRRQLFLNFKGGTGKTSISVSYAYRLAEMGYRVLVIDLDSQGHATQCLGFEGDKYEATIFDVLVKKASISDVVVKTQLEELDMVPANLGMSTVDLSLMPLSAREFRLKRALDAVRGYEFIIMDAPPSFGLLNLNALMAADDLFVPVLPDFLSFHGLKLLFETVGELEDDLGHSLDRIFIVLNQYNPTTKIAREAKSALETHYPEFLLNTVVRQCTRFAQASSEGLPICAYDPGSRGSEDVDSFITEVSRLIQRDAGKEKIA